MAAVGFNIRRLMKISVVIHTYNSEKFLERVLNSVSGFDEIVICDMYSTDKTLEIAKNTIPGLFSTNHAILRSRLVILPSIPQPGNGCWLHYWLRGVGNVLRMRSCYRKPFSVIHLHD